MQCGKSHNTKCPPSPHTKHSSSIPDRSAARGLVSFSGEDNAESNVTSLAIKAFLEDAGVARPLVSSGSDACFSAAVAFLRRELSFPAPFFCTGSLAEGCSPAPALLLGLVKVLRKLKLGNNDASAGDGSVVSNGTREPTGRFCNYKNVIGVQI